MIVNIGPGMVWGPMSVNNGNVTVGQVDRLSVDNEFRDQNKIQSLFALRVTRLGEFSPNGCFFYFGPFFCKLQKWPTFWDTLFNVLVMH
jgi:hypothetical protein